MSRLFTRCWLLVALLALPLTVAQAQDFHPPGSRGAAMAGAMGAICDDGYGAWYNPAQLIAEDKFKFGVQFSGMIPDLSATVVNRGTLGWIPYFQDHNADGSLSNGQTLLRTQRMFNEEARPEPLYGFNIHLLLPLKRMIPKFPLRVGFGAAVFAPCAGACIVKVNAHTPDQPFYPVFGSRVQRLQILLGVGIEVIKELLSVGASVSVLAAMEGTVGSMTPISTFDPDNPDSGQPEPSKATFSQDLGSASTPQLGLLVTPLGRKQDIDLRIGAFYRFPQRLSLKFAVDAGVAMDMGYSIEANMPYFLKSSFFYVPAAAGVSVGARLARHLVLAAQVDWVFWADLPNNINLSRFEVAPEQINDNGGLRPMEEYGDFRVRSLAFPKIRARNILIPRFGAEYAIKGLTRLRLGWAYTPSALDPDQQFQNLLLDNSYHTVSTGIGFSLKDPLEYLKYPILLDVHYTTNILNPRHNRVGLKDEPAGYHAQGVVLTEGYFFGFGVELTLQL